MLRHVADGQPVVPPVRLPCARPGSRQDAFRSNAAILPGRVQARCPWLAGRCYARLASMTAHPDAPVRERRWLLLAEEGNHSWLGRATDPDEEDVGRAETSLRRAGVGGWLAVSEGDYWGKEPVTLLEVRALNAPRAAFAQPSRRSSNVAGKGCVELLPVW